MSNPTTQPDRTLPEQVEFAYLTLLGHLENLAAFVQELSESPADIDIQDLEQVQDRVNRMLSKNFRLRHKIQMHRTPEK
jgi:hypothetical protein